MSAMLELWGYAIEYGLLHSAAYLEQIFTLSPHLEHFTSSNPNRRYLIMLFLLLIEYCLLSLILIYVELSSYLTLYCEATLSL